MEEYLLNYNVYFIENLFSLVQNRREFYWFGIEYLFDYLTSLIETTCSDWQLGKNMIL